LAGLQPLPYTLFKRPDMLIRAESDQKVEVDAGWARDWKKGRGEMVLKLARELWSEELEVRVTEGSGPKKTDTVYFTFPKTMRCGISALKAAVAHLDTCSILMYSRTAIWSCPRSKVSDNILHYSWKQAGGRRPRRISRQLA